MDCSYQLVALAIAYLTMRYVAIVLIASVLREIGINFA